MNVMQGLAFDEAQNAGNSYFPDFQPRKRTTKELIGDAKETARKAIDAFSKVSISQKFAQKRVNKRAGLVNVLKGNVVVLRAHLKGIQVKGIVSLFNKIATFIQLQAAKFDHMATVNAMKPAEKKDAAIQATFDKAKEAKSTSEKELARLKDLYFDEKRAALQ